MRRYLLPAALAALAAACSSPPVRFHALPTPAASAASAGRALVLGPVRIPAYLGRSQVTWREGELALVFDDNNRWGSAFDAELVRALGEHLGAAAGTLDVVTFPGRTSSADAQRISVDIEQLDVTSGGPARLRARFSIRRGEDDALVADGVADIRETTGGRGADAAV
ncbi:MAG: PqiC family protein, partial [bacterium]